MRILAWFGAWLLRVHAATLRFRVDGREGLEVRLAAGERLVLCGFHQDILGGLPVWFARYPMTIMISQSRDGELISQIVERLGWQTVRGSSSRGGVRGLIQMTREVLKGRVGAMIVDGPRGPARAVKPGLIPIAQRSGASIVTVSLCARWRWRPDSWDRIQVPFPFSQIAVSIGEPIPVPAELTTEAAEALRLEVERRLVRESERLEALLHP